MTQGDIQRTVLVVEDDALIRMSAVASLEDLGLDVLEAANSAEALVLLARHAEICVMVTDVRMPGAMDGLTLVSRVCRDHPHIRAIVVSDNATAAQAYTAGAVMFMAKPYLTPELVEAVFGLVPHNQAPLGFAA
jgi:two-component system, response regulator PdtaR